MTAAPRVNPADEIAISGETVALKLCHACEAELLERDRFCRRCGVSQSLAQTPSTAKVDRSSSPYATAPLIAGEWCRPISGPLLQAVTAGVSATTSARLDSPIARRLILVLISIPIWLIIILLSPIDAYTAAKAVTRQI